MQPSTLYASASDVSGQSLPLKAFEPTIEIRDRKTRSVYIEAPFSVETGEAERIAVDWTAKGGSGGTSRAYPSIPVSSTSFDYSLVESHLHTQRAAVKMLHDRIMLLVQYVSGVIAGQWLSV